VANPAPRPLRVLFFRTDAEKESVREWLNDLSRDEKKVIGADILTVQWVWPVGKPLVDSLGGGLWEVRSSLGDRIARVFFIVVDEEIILLHGIIKKSRTAPKRELELARKRQSIYLQSTEPINESKSTAERSPRK
jgi:phage-related protein